MELKFDILREKKMPIPAINMKIVEILCMLSKFTTFSALSYGDLSRFL